MKNKVPFKHLCSLEQVQLRQLQSLVLSFPESLWKKDQERKKEFVSHIDVDSIVLKFCSNETFEDASEREEFLSLKSILLPVMDRIAGLYTSEQPFYSRILIARLKGNGCILEHDDWENVHQFTHRIHLPIITNDKVLMKVAGVERFLAEGEVYEISNKDKHSVVNGSTEFRVHLIFDVVDPKFLLYLL